MRTRLRISMGSHGGSLFRLLALVTVFLSSCVCLVATCNIDDMTDDLIKYTGDPGSYFGYTTVQHTNAATTPWILVGAPRGRSAHQPSLERPGALWKCRSNSPYICDQILLDSTGNQDFPAEKIVDVKDNQWLGVTLARQTNRDKNGDVSVCGHLWSNDYYINEDPTSENEGVDRFPNGICYVADANFEQVKKLRPCVDEIQTLVNGTYRYQGSCQAGISAAYTKDGDLMLGAVGSYEWAGTTIKADKNGDTYRYTFGNLSDWNMMGEKHQTEYIGYSVSSGNFRSVDTEQGVTGAPRSDSVGKVFIYNLETFEMYTQLRGEQMGSYYGGAVLGVDFNNDGLSDLLVGAPLYTVKQDEGLVYVYINKGAGRMELQDFKLEGTRAIGGRFGSAIAFIGDINLDGFNDVAIGAPYEDENTGAVYIYRGYIGGIQRTYSQRIAARALANLPGLQSFGSSISGGMDIDFNEYPDIIVGAYANDTVVLFKTLPVIRLKAWIAVDPLTLDPEFLNCILRNRSITCLDVEVCFEYTDEHGLPEDVKFDYNLEVDTLKSDIGAASRFFFMTDGGSEATSIADTVELKKDVRSCYLTKAYLRGEAGDFLTPLKFLLNYNVFDYQPQGPLRGDEVYRFKGNLPPVYDACSNGTAEKMVLFVGDCGSDSICQTNIKVVADLEAQSGNPYITLGGDSVVYLLVEVHNQGEEAHNSELLITHPREVVYESLETTTVECLQSSTCTPDNTITCAPREAYNETAEVLCFVGNPMRSNTVSILRMRFDVGGIALGRKVVDLSIAASTISVEEGANGLRDNTVTVKLPVLIVADIAVRGVVQPEQIFYSPDNETVDGKAPDKEALLRQALVGAGFLDGDGKSNMKGIGPTFTHIYEVGNQGPGRLPFDGKVTIQLPWRANNGDWLIYFKSIQMNGGGKCDGASVLEQQRFEIMDHYLDSAGMLAYSNDGLALDDSSNQDFDCDRAQCVTVTCTVEGPMNSRAGVVVTADALLWQRTLIDNEMGIVDLISTAIFELQDTSRPHTQPDDGMPDTIQLKTTIFTDEVLNKPVEPWVIAVSTIGGILGLVMLVAALWKVGFFERKTVDDIIKSGAP
ncbi:integrin alpha-9-like [Asterias rubens]|uniref:integrin alpha-9-like n=1 Tax=Asterias rubens TaxID=7604 RepID=UPI0014551222|nr:integrin alpha-9-like [Asterias rubens]